MNKEGLDVNIKINSDEFVNSLYVAIKQEIYDNIISNVVEKLTSELLQNLNIKNEVTNRINTYMNDVFNNEVEFVERRNSYYDNDNWFETGAKPSTISLENLVKKELKDKLNNSWNREDYEKRIRDYVDKILSQKYKS